MSNGRTVEVRDCLSGRNRDQAISGGAFMSLTAQDIIDGTVLISSQFSEPMRVIGTPTAGDGFVLVNLVGTRTSTFRGGVTLTKQDLGSIQIERKDAVFGGKPRLFKL